MARNAALQGNRRRDSRPPHSFRTGLPYSRRLSFETLEDRRMLSTINWSNRATFSGANDNRFDDVFGTLQNQAIAVIDAAIDAWEGVIDQFNYSNGTDTYQVMISMNATAIGSGPGGIGANATVNGFIGSKPSSATVGIGWRSGITAGTNSAAGWYLDPTPADSSEFSGINTAPQTNAFVGLPTTNLGGGDMFTAVLHELGHAMGLSSNSVINAFATNTNVTDAINMPASSPAATYWRFDSPNVHSLWRGWDSGGAGGNATNAAGAQHFAPQNAQVTADNRTYDGAVGLMNASFTSRSLIDDNLAYMLQDAYGYTVTPQSSIGTFYDRLDADGSLHISTPAGSIDQVTVQVVADKLRVSMNLGSPIRGIDPNSIFTDFLLTSITSIDINTGDQPDTVILSAINSSIPITLNMAGGTDELRINGSAGYDNLTVDNPRITSTGLNITQFAGVLHFPRSVHFTRRGRLGGG